MGIYFGYSQYVSYKRGLTETIKPIVFFEVQKQTVYPSSSTTIPIVSSSLKYVIENALSGTSGTYGIIIQNLKTGEIYDTNAHTVFDTASLYKLWVMATVYKQIQNGQLDENQVISQDVATLNQEFDIDPNYAELAEGTVTFTIREALTQMITISHNYAALLLTEKIGLFSVARFLTDNGFTESIVGTYGESPTATPSDIALFFKKLYKGELANQEYTDDMINLLKNQQLNEGVSKYLPDKSNVANKTGEIDYLKHDGGIVFTDKGDYIIVVMSESDNPPAAQERIALVSKGVFDYFTSKK